MTFKIQVQRESYPTTTLNPVKKNPVVPEEPSRVCRQSEPPECPASRLPFPKIRRPSGSSSRYLSPRHPQQCLGCLDCLPAGEVQKLRVPAGKSTKPRGTGPEAQGQLFPQVVGASSDSTASRNNLKDATSKSNTTARVLATSSLEAWISSRAMAGSGARSLSTSG